MFPRIPFDKVNWLISPFLIGTLFLSLTAVPAYIWFFGIDWFQIGLFFVMFFSIGFSITLGYHRLFSHLTFQAHWTVRLLTLIFGAAAFESSVLVWACEHRNHHKHVDHPDEWTQRGTHLHIDLQPTCPAVFQPLTQQNSLDRKKKMQKSG
jgi:stearoyl-CoA desaturase (Delta-9 desaturase)